ncbi:DUF692 family multinuclear iron-containing protein [Dyadobacter sp. CY356]|uniref:multinuclear nonheme iron-dependent oxidase n=1 Tax=Dyadobacter sp. CY356 TaxID=2906442 RepID=UPI001F29F178|nr:DUF692 family multinuclear iron-containing protein [Dyadobacter sp. CY356]MCF0054754.1 DUF692 domain-containing protein [Dyadobacter sp. CY356]
MSTIFSSVACNLDTNILLASLPLFEREQIEAIEWSFDTLFKNDEVPDWFSDLILEFSSQNRLIGHGVYFSLFSGKWMSEQQDWLKKLKILGERFQFDHITEHFGFMTGANFHKGAPISIPLTASTMSLGVDRLHRIQDACNCPVGLENLAFSFSLDEVKRQGNFLDKLVESINGFIILDLHNLYCQIHNFDVDYDYIIDLYPLERVREIHISGGSWDIQLTRTGKKVRRDTHDDAVPEEVFQILSAVIPRCTNLKFVVLEQLGTALDSEVKRTRFRSDFERMDAIVKQSGLALSNSPVNNFKPHHKITPHLIPLEDLSLYNQQLQLSTILETAVDQQHARHLLLNSDLRDSVWEVEKWDPCMLQTAIAIAQKWKDGF